MLVQEMANLPSAWVKANGPEAEIVFSCRVRLARNLEGFVFPSWADNSVRKSVSEKVLEAVGKNNYFKKGRTIDMNRLSSIERRFFMERHLISMEFTEPTDHTFLVIEKEEIISLMINEEDHLRLQVILSGLQLLEAWRLSDRVDDELEKNLDYAFLPKWGYLTTCPTNTGTGMRASCMVHLPALIAVGKINDLLRSISKLGLIVRGLYGEGTEVQGDFFQISNQVTLGLKEEEITDNVVRVTRQVVEQEKKARELLLKKNRIQLEDEVGRAYGTLVNARLIGSKEAITLLSKLRLGTSLSLCPELKLDVLNELFFLITPAQLQVRKGKELSSFSRDELRARMVREKLSILK